MTKINELKLKTRIVIVNTNQITHIESEKVSNHISVNKMNHLGKIDFSDIHCITIYMSNGRTIEANLKTNDLIHLFSYDVVYLVINDLENDVWYDTLDFKCDGFVEANNLVNKGITIDSCLIACTL